MKPNINLFTPAFSKTAEELKKDSYLLKDTMNFEQAEEYCKNFRTYESHYVPLSMEDKQNFSGVVYVYKDGKPYGHARMKVEALGYPIEEKEFFENYEGKPVALDSFRKDPEVEKHVYAGETYLEIVFKTYENLFTEHDYYNFLVMQKCEEEWLEDPRV